MYKRPSQKDKKMSGKTPVIESSQIICWICHQEMVSAEAKLEKASCLQSNYTRKIPNYFRPCLCKGSIGTVHQECLNRWVLEKYKMIAKKPSKGYEEDLPAISCPNCRTQYEYNLFESKKFSDLKGLKINSAESICLMVLIVSQISLLAYQFILSPPPEQPLISDGPDDPRNNMRWLDYIHVVTAIIVLAAGGFNLLENSCTELKIEVLSQF